MQQSASSPHLVRQKGLGGAVAIIPAAGSAARMGTLKQLLPFGSSTVLQTVIQTVLSADLEDVVVVVGPNHADAAALARELRSITVVNPHPERGMTSSVQMGISATPDADAWLILPADCPEVTGGDVRAVLRSAKETTHGMVVAVHNGRRGHPLLLKSEYRDLILGLPTERGLNTLVRANADDVQEVDCSAGVLRDLDTPEDYKEAKSRVSHHSVGGQGHST